MRIVRAHPQVQPSTVAVLGIGVLAIASSGPMIAYAAAPALAIAFWRNGMAVGVLAPWALLRRRHELVALASPTGRRDGFLCLLSGVALAAHFATWVPSAKLTSVAAATALVATQPVWQGLISLAQGRRLPAAAWAGIGLAVTGTMVATGADFGVSGTAVLGDLLAVVGGLMAAVYTALGERVRATTSTTAYTTVCYSVCALVLVVVCLTSGTPLAGFSTATWIALVCMTVGPQLLGHSMFNFALRRVSATTISMVVLLEVPGAALIGWLWLGQRPGTAALVGIALLVSGVAVVILANRRAARSADAIPAAPTDLAVWVPD
jgi:drug/metabolite transporter (DMT)-like permease